MKKYLFLFFVLILIAPAINADLWGDIKDFLGLEGRVKEQNMAIGEEFEDVYLGGDRGEHRLTIYSGIRNIYENDKWVRIEDAKSLKDRIGWHYEKFDGNYWLFVNDFNYTSIEVCASVSPIYFNKQVPLSLMINETYEKSKLLLSFSDAKENCYTLQTNNILNKEIKFGFNSTLIVINSTQSDRHARPPANAVWATVRDATTSTGGEIGTGGYIHAWLLTGNYYLMRVFVNFNTSSIPDDAEIQSVNLSIAFLDEPNVNQYYYITANMSGGIFGGRPSQPCIETDFGRLHYATIGGRSPEANGYGANSWIQISFNSTGLQFINKSGNTTLVIRENTDIENIAPTEASTTRFYLGGIDVAYNPYLNITYFTNTPPIIHWVNITPGTSYTNNSLNCVFNISEVDDQDVYFNVTWFRTDFEKMDLSSRYFYQYGNVTNRSGGNMTTNSSGILPTTNTSKGQTFICQIWITDGTATAIKNSSAVVIQNSKPLIPNLIWPENNTLHIINFPTFSWQNTTDEDKETLQYLLQVDNNSNVFSVVPYFNIVAETANTSDAINITFATNQSVFWRITAFDNSTLNSTASAVWNFSYIPNLAPSIPVLNYPYNNTNITNYIWFNWSNSTDYEDSTLIYNFEVDNDATFGSLNLWDYNIQEATNTQIQINNTLIDSYYYWRVSAEDSEGVNSSFAVREFLLSRYPPEINITHPYNFTTNQSEYLDVDFFFNVTDNIDIANCSLIINDKINITYNKNFTKGIEENITIQSYHNKQVFNWSINCTNQLNQQNSSKVFGFVYDPNVLANLNSFESYPSYPIFTDDIKFRINVTDNKSNADIYYNLSHWKNNIYFDDKWVKGNVSIRNGNWLYVNSTGTIQHQNITTGDSWTTQLVVIDGDLTIQYNTTYSIGGFFNCTEGNATQAIVLNFTFYDELNKSKFNLYQVDFDAMFTMWRDPLSTSNVTFSLSNITEVDFCISPANQSIYLNSTIEYIKSGYEVRNYYHSNQLFDNITDEVKLFLLNSGNATGIQLIVTDEVETKQENVYIYIYRFDIGNNTYDLVAMGKSDQDGSDYIYMQRYDSWYKFVLEQNDEIVFTSKNMRILTSPLYLRIRPSTVGEILTQFEGISYSLTYNNATNVFTLVYFDPANNLKKGCLSVIKRTASGDTDLCKECIYAPSATITCTTDNSTGIYIATFTAGINPEHIISILTEQVRATAQLYKLVGLDGVAAAFFITGTLSFFGYYYPPVSIALGLVGILVSASLGLIYVTWGMIIGLIISGVIIISKMTK